MHLLSLYITPIDGSRVKAIADAPNGGHADVDLELPFGGHAERRLTALKALEVASFRRADFPDADELAWMAEQKLFTTALSDFTSDFRVRIGQLLFNALFPEGSQTRDVLQRALAAAELQNANLHIRIEAPSDDRGLRLMDYPWELIHDGRGFLAVRRATFSRYIADRSVPPNLALADSINVLLVSSQASDPENGLSPLAGDEQESVRAGLELAASWGRVHVDVLPLATWKRLQAYLTQHRGRSAPHVVHFDGHGLFGSVCPGIRADQHPCAKFHPDVRATTCSVCGRPLPAPQGFLVFEDESGAADYISAQRLGELLGATGRDDDFPHARIALVVLSACLSGLSPARGTLFNGVAQSLIEHGIPSVVAMQFSVSVAAAKAFAEQFYRALGEQNPLASAVQNGRLAMNTEGIQWYRPILYLRWQDNEGGRLFGPRIRPVPEDLVARAYDLLWHLDPQPSEDELWSAARRCLPNDFPPPARRGKEALRGVLEWLAGYGRLSDASVPMIRFVEELHRSVGQPGLWAALDNWQQMLAAHLGTTVTASRTATSTAKSGEKTTPAAQPGASAIYFVVELEPGDLDEPLQDCYAVHVWMVGDETQFVFTTPEPVSLSEVPSILGQVLDMTAEHPAAAGRDPYFEFLMPKRLLAHSFEDWFVLGDQPLLVSFPVATRVAERNRSKKYWWPWRQRWRAVASLLKSPIPPEQVIWSGDPTPEQHRRDVQASLQFRACLALTASPSGDRQTAVVAMMLRDAGTPIALWPGCGVDVQEARLQLEDLLCGGPLEDLPRRVWQARCQIWAAPGSNAGRLPALVWDDFSRLVSVGDLSAPSREG